MQIRLFGGVSAVTDRGEPVDVGPAKCQAVLAALALSPGSAVPVWRLVELVWGEESPRTAERTLQSYVTRLRKSLGPDAIVRNGGAYRLDVTPDLVDVGRFERRLDSGDVEGALAEWTGAPLAGLETPGLTPAVDALTERWLGATELDLERRLEAEAPVVIGSLTELTARYPFREGFWALLMTALYRVGRQADALAAYRTARAQLVERLGVEPGPRLRELETLILGHDEQLAFRRPEAAAGRPTGAVTFAFAEVEGASRLWAAARQAMSSATARLDELLRATAAEHGGWVFAGGESTGVAFHRTSEAAAWADDVHAAVRREPWPGSIAIRLRVGLHTGEADETPTGYFGPAVHMAARLAAAGHSGQTLLSAAAAALLDGAEVRDLGFHQLAGVVAEQRILQLGGDDHPPLRSEARRGNLPRGRGRLIGRDRELEEVGQRLTASAIVTLVGPGGIGKTRLAIEAARQADVPDGAWLAELADLTSGNDVPQAVADILGVKEGPGRTLTRSVATALRARRALLVLDNCEHVLDAAAAFAEAIVEGCPEVRLLATSREPLGVGGEQIVDVPPLDPSGPGAQLFNERAAAASRAFDADASAAEVAEICRRLDGLPLAIELAAARVRALSPGDLLLRLDDRLRLLTGGRRTAGERQRTLRATIQWSYDLLLPAERSLFRQLSVFTGPFGFAAAETVAADGEFDPVGVDALLSGLADRSMVVVEFGALGRRFRILETMRQFGAERLSGPARAGLRRRHAGWCVREATRVGRLLTGPEEVEGVVRLRELWPNLRTAVEWACGAGERDLALALVRPVAAEVLLRSQHELGDWIERILALPSSGDERTLVFGLVWAARRYALSQDRDAYERLVRRRGEPDDVLVRHARAFVYEDYEARAALAPRAAAEARRRGEGHLAELLEIDVGASLLNLGRFEEADAVLVPLADRYRSQGPPTYRNWALMLLGYSAMLRGLHERAERYFDDAIAVDVPERTYSPNRPIEARAAFKRGERARAFAILRAHVEELLDADNMHGGSIDCLEFVNMMAALDRLEEAGRMLGYLETTGLLDAPAWRTLVADSASRIAGRPQGLRDQEAGRALDDREALAYMRGVLESLAGEPTPPPARPTRGTRG